MPTKSTKGQFVECSITALMSAFGRAYHVEHTNQPIFADRKAREMMTDAIRQLCDTVFETTDILRIYAEPFSHNIGSRRALEKAGFALEGIMKNNAVKNGKVLDMTMYALTKEPQLSQKRNRNKAV